MTAAPGRPPLLSLRSLIALDYEWKKQYGEKIHKAPLNGGMTCPNQDGTVGSGGCSAEEAVTSLRTQSAFPSNRSNPRKKSSDSFRRSILWFTSRLIPTLLLRWTISGKFSPRPSHPDIVVLSIGTRPDACLTMYSIFFLPE